MATLKLQQFWRGFGVACLCCAFVVALGLAPSAHAQAPAVDKTPAIKPATLKPKISLSNGTTHAATIRNGAGKNVEVAPKKGLSVTTSKFPYTVTYWSGKGATGWKTLAITKAGTYGFQYTDGEFFLQPVTATASKISLSNPGTHDATIRNSAGKNVVIAANKGMSITTSKFPYTVTYWSGTAAVGWKTANIAKAGSYGFQYANGQFSLVPKAVGRTVASTPRPAAKVATGKTSSTRSGGSTGSTRTPSRSGNSGRTVARQPAGGGSRSGGSRPSGSSSSSSGGGSRAGNAGGNRIANGGTRRDRFAGVDSKLSPESKKLVDNAREATKVHESAQKMLLEAKLDQKESDITEMKAEKALKEAEERLANGMGTQEEVDEAKKLHEEAMANADAALKNAQEAEDHAKEMQEHKDETTKVALDDMKAQGIPVEDEDAGTAKATAADDDAEMAEKDAELAETDAEIAETDAEMAEIDAEIAETDAEIAETDAEMAEIDAEIAETDAEIAETDAAMAEEDAAMEDEDAAMEDEDAAMEGEGGVGSDDGVGGDDGETSDGGDDGASGGDDGGSDE